MPVVEVAQLRLKGVAPDDPALLRNLSSVRAILKTQSEFYSCIDDPRLVFILGFWPSLEAHRGFLASPRAAEVLGSQESMLEFRWALHMELDTMASLPLDAPVLAITRRQVREDDVAAYDKALATEKDALVQGSKHKVVGGWRVDAAPGVHEALLFTGWENAQAYAASSARQTAHDHHHDGTGASALHEVLETYCASNLERSLP
jgi:heme-degrading monooxygenase HmoA